MRTAAYASVVAASIAAFATAPLPAQRTSKKTALPPYAKILAALDARADHFAGVAKQIWGFAEVGYQEVKSSALLQQELSSETNLPRGAMRIGAVPTAMPIVARFAAMLQARHPGILPAVLSLSSSDLEKGLQDLTIDLALGYLERMDLQGTRLTAWPQYTEHYFLLRKAANPHPDGLQIGPKMQWKDAARLPLCLLTPDMHNRTIVDAAFTTAGAPVKPAIETNSILTMALSVVAGTVCSVMPGALVGAVRGYRELEALPLVGPDVRTSIGFMSHAAARPSRALEAALTLAQDGAWLRHAAAHSGLLTI